MCFSGLKFKLKRESKSDISIWFGRTCFFGLFYLFFDEILLIALR